MKKQYISEMAWNKIFNFLKEQEKIYIKEEKCCKSLVNQGNMLFLMRQVHVCIMAMWLNGVS